MCNQMSTSVSGSSFIGGRRVENYDAGQTVKLSCRNVWKIYGDTSDSFFMDRNGNVDDPQAHVKKS